MFVHFPNVYSLILVIGSGIVTLLHCRLNLHTKASQKTKTSRISTTCLWLFVTDCSPLFNQFFFTARFVPPWTPGMNGIDDIGRIFIFSFVSIPCGFWGKYYYFRVEDINSFVKNRCRFFDDFIPDFIRITCYFFFILRFNRSAFFEALYFNEFQNFSPLYNDGIWKKFMKAKCL